MTFLSAFLIFTGLIATLSFQARINVHDVRIHDVAGASFGCGLIVIGAGMIAGA